MRIRRTISRPMLPVIVILLAFAGTWLCGQLLKHHDRLWDTPSEPTGLFGWMCAAGAGLGMDCEASRQNRWSSLTLPAIVWRPGHGPDLTTRTVPLALIGMIHFATLGCWFAIVGGPQRHGIRWHYLPLTLALAGAAGSLILLSGMAVGTFPPCAGCIIAHLVNLLLAAAVARLCLVRRERIPFPPAESPWRRPPATWHTAVTAICVSAAFAAGCWIHRSGLLAMKREREKLLPYKKLVTDLREDRDFLRREHLSQPVYDLTLAAMTAETAANRAQLVVYIDYDCPGCACQVEDVIGRARQAFGDALDVQVRHYPLGTACNPHVSRDIHPGACLAACAAEAARSLGGDQTFWAMHRLLSMHRGARDRAALSNLAVGLGLDRGQFLARLDEPAIRELISTQVNSAVRAGVKGTPAFFLNGRRINRWFEGPALWQTLAADWSQGHRPSVLSAGLSMHQEK